MASDITINYFHRSIRDDIILSYLERKPFLLSLLSFDNKNKNLDSDWSIRPTSTSIREYVAKILSWMREKPGASEKTIFHYVCRGFIEFFFYFISLSRWQSSDRIGKDCEFFFLYFLSVYVSPAQAERDLDGVFIVGGFVEILQRFHALVLRATRRVAMVQHRLEKHLALWIVSGTREEGG